MASIFSVGLGHRFSHAMWATGVDTFDSHRNMCHMTAFEHCIAAAHEVREQLLTLAPNREAIAEIFLRQPFDLSKVTISGSQESEGDILFDFIQFFNQRAKSSAVTYKA